MKQAKHDQKDARMPRKNLFADSALAALKSIADLQFPDDMLKYLPQASGSALHNKLYKR